MGVVPRKGGSMRRNTKDRHLGHRDALRARLALDLVDGSALTAQQVRGRYYAGVSASSFHKTFKRDRDALAAEGIHLIEEPLGTAKIWKLDRKRSLARLSAIADEEARVAATLLRPLVDNGGTSDRSELGCAVARIGRTVDNALLPKTERSCSRQVLSAVAEGLKTRRPCELAYTAAGEQAPRTRTLLTYGIFELGGNVYAVGLRRREGTPDALRTLNLGRASQALVRSDQSRYDIPPDFDVNDYRLLPFELGDEEPTLAQIYISRSCAAAFKEQARKRGRQHSKQGGAIDWAIEVRNTQACASWCVEVGALPISPRPLVSAWEQLLKGGLENGS